ncbi:MAG: hypothetical protein WA172_04760 [Terriglobales bacterium]
MSDQQIGNQEMSDHGSFEHEDLSPHGVMYFMLGLAVVVVVIYLIVFGMYHFLDTYEKGRQTAMSPMVAPQAGTRTVTHADTQVFPQPRLEESERSQLRQFIEQEDDKLATYNWVDKDKGIVQIPIERAMDLIVQRGLPVRPENARPGNERPEGPTKILRSTAQVFAPATKKKQTPPTVATKAAEHGN